MPEHREYERVQQAGDSTSQRSRGEAGRDDRDLAGLVQASRADRRTINPRVVQRLQRVAGNRSAGVLVSRFLAPRSTTPTAEPALQRDDGNPMADVSVTKVNLTASKVTVPLSKPLKASAVPKNATGVKFRVKKNTVEPSNVAIDAATGAITIASGQQGGAIDVMAEAADGSAAWTSLQIIEQPNGVAKTSASGALDYGGEFVHTFTAPSGASSGLEGANINETFASTTAEMPWGGQFTLKANKAGSQGWDLDATGAMTGPDTVDIASSSVNVGKFIASASNPNPTAKLPQGFTMTQQMFGKVFPGGQRSATAATKIDHTRTLVAGPKFEVAAGLGKVSEDYTGPAAVTNAKASSTTVMASPPKPATGTWNQRTVTVTADPIPSGASLAFSIVGKSLGCSVDSNGSVSIGSTPGTITVRATASPGNYDEVKITITKYEPPATDVEGAATQAPGDTALEGDRPEEP